MKSNGQAFLCEEDLRLLVLSDKKKLRVRAKQKVLSKKQVSLFQQLLYAYYENYGRDLPWRKQNNPYATFVSEVMLQQTQVPRVCEKYPAFLRAFPTVDALANAPVEDVIVSWQGMGYNRRALHLKRAAEIILENYGGAVPADPELLERLPGIGKATAASIAAFAYNRPELFLETNIRTVLIFFFLFNEENVDDKVLLSFLDRVLDRENSSVFYNATMDYGTLLKKLFGNLSRRSLAYQKQSSFEGSRRQLRGMLLRRLSAGAATRKELLCLGEGHKHDVKEVLGGLAREGFIRESGNGYRLLR